MAPNKRLLAAWKDGVRLGDAWWVFADNRNRKRFRELQKSDSHLGLQHYLELEVKFRLGDGELRAIGIEEGSDKGPVFIPEYYFLKTAEVDYYKETVAALGKKFCEVRVQGEREPWLLEPSEETPPSGPEVSMDSDETIDLHELSAQRKREREQGRLDDTLRSVPTTSTEPRETTNQGEREPRHGTLPSEPTRVSEPEESAVPIEPESGPELLSTGTSPRRGPGRPDKSAEIDQAIDLLLGRRVDLPGMPRPQAFKAIRKCAASELKSNINIGFSDPVLQRALFRRFGRRR